MTTHTNNSSRKIHEAIRYFEQDNLQSAEECCRKILEDDPDDAPASHLLGVIVDRNGNPDLAAQLIRKAISLTPDRAIYHNNLGNVLRNLDQHEEALAAYSNAVRLNPAFAEAFNNMGNIYMEMDQLDKAVISFKHAIKLRPDIFLSYFNIGRALQELGLLDLAISAFKQAVQLKPDFTEAYFYMGLALKQHGLLNEAEISLRKTLQLDPHHASACRQLANVFRYMGRPDDALAYYWRTLELAPKHYEIYYLISSMISQRAPTAHFSETHADVLRLRQLLDSEELADDQAKYLHFALGDMYDNFDSYAAAFEHYQQANRMCSASKIFSIPEITDSVEQIITTFSKEFFGKMKNCGSDSLKPAFIVGLPRSGKTLTEQLSVLHNQVFAGEELTRLARLIEKDLPYHLKLQEEFPLYVDKVDSTKWRETAAEYVNHITNIAGDSYSRIINTMPGNIFLLGVIALLFPRAKIIYCRRHMLDNCLAMYFTCFAEGNEYSFDLEPLGFYYRQVERLMAHWQKVLPANIYIVDYENLVTEPTQMAQGLIDFLELDWNEECAETLQARFFSRLKENGQPLQILHNRFIGRAEKYKEFLGPLEASLKKYNISQDEN